jgi:hypothetical protein
MTPFRALSTLAVLALLAAIGWWIWIRPLYRDEIEPPDGEPPPLVTTHGERDGRLERAVLAGRASARQRWKEFLGGEFPPGNPLAVHLVTDSTKVQEPSWGTTGRDWETFRACEDITHYKPRGLPSSSALLRARKNASLFDLIIAAYLVPPTEVPNGKGRRFLMCRGDLRDDPGECSTGVPSSWVVPMLSFVRERVGAARMAELLRSAHKPDDFIFVDGTPTAELDRIDAVAQFETEFDEYLQKRLRLSERAAR